MFPYYREFDESIEGKICTIVMLIIKVYCRKFINSISKKKIQQIIK